MSNEVKNQGGAVKDVVIDTTLIRAADSEEFADVIDRLYELQESHPAYDEIRELADRLQRVLQTLIRYERKHAREIADLPTK